MIIQEHIEKLIEEAGKDFKLLNYVYNNDSEFDPTSTPVYYSGPYWDKEEIIAAIESLIIGKWISSGEYVRKFEVKFARRMLQNDAVMVNSGSSANLIMLAAVKKLYKWEDGDEVIVSVVGFPTTIAPIIQNNLKPIFIDIELTTLNFDTSLIESKITPKTKAILISPVLGNPPDFDELLFICKEHNLILLLDNCDSLGSKWSGFFLNQLVTASTYSFYPAHHISTGEGGMITSNNPELIKLARSFAWWGRDCYCVGTANLLSNGTCNHRFDTWLEDYNGLIDHKYVFVNMGYNLKPLDLQGAIGLVQLNKLDEIHNKRKRSKEIISDLFLKYIKDISIPKILKYAEPAWFGTPIICKDRTQKEKLVLWLEKNRIQTRNYFAGNILIHPAYKYLDNFKEYPNANKVLELVFFVGAAPHYDENIFNYFEKVLKEYK